MQEFPWSLSVFSLFYQCLADIEEHLGITISQVNPDCVVPVDQYDGKVVYGQKRKAPSKEMFKMQNAIIKYYVILTASAYQSHVAQMAGAVQELAVQEMKAQLLFHSFATNTKKIFGTV